MSTNTHSHSYTELLLCLAGDHFYGMHAKAQSLSPGEVLLFPPGVRHDSGYSRHHGAGADLWFHFLTPKHVGINIVEHRVGTRILYRREFRRVEKNHTARVYRDRATRAGLQAVGTWPLSDLGGHRLRVPNLLPLQPHL